MASSTHLSTFLIILLLQFASVTSRCAVNYIVECNENGVHSATSVLTFRVTDDNDGAGVESEYDATVTFHWGDGIDDTNFGSRAYITGEQQEVRSTHFLPEDGRYNVGYTLTLGEGSGMGCEGKSFEKYYLIQYKDNYCTVKSGDHEDNEPDPPPAANATITDEPTTDEPTPSPITDDPTTDEPTTDEPTDEPTPSTITDDPTPSPSSIQPLTGKPINGKANTASPTPEVEDDGGTLTAIPSFTPTEFPTKFPTISAQQRTTAAPNSNVVCLTEEEVQARVEAVCGAEPRVTESPNLSVSKAVPLVTAANSSGKTTLGASIGILSLMSVSLMLF